MKKVARKFITIVIVVLLTLALSTGVFAENITPRWVDLSAFSCTLSRENGLFSNSKVYAHASSWISNDTINLTVTIQKWNGSSYVNTSYTWSSSNKASSYIDKTMNLNAGNYIAHAVATVYDANGNYVETVTLNSNEIII